MEPVTSLFKENLFMKAFAFLQIPMLAYARPKILQLDDEMMEVKIPLSRRTKNHLRSMYFGALAVGADTAVGMLAYKKIRDSGKPVNLIFKDFKADYHKRAEGDVHFVCREGEAIGKLVDDAIKTKERQSKKFKAYAYVPSIDPDEPVATFELTLSLKLASKKK